MGHPNILGVSTHKVQSGLLRTYALAFTVAVGLLTLVFLVVK